MWFYQSLNNAFFISTDPITAEDGEQTSLSTGDFDDSCSVVCTLKDCF